MMMYLYLHKIQQEFHIYKIIKIMRKEWCVFALCYSIDEGTINGIVIYFIVIAQYYGILYMQINFIVNEKNKQKTFHSF